MTPAKADRCHFVRKLPCWMARVLAGEMLSVITFLVDVEEAPSWGSYLLNRRRIDAHWRGLLEMLHFKTVLVGEVSPCLSRLVTMDYWSSKLGQLELGWCKWACVTPSFRFHNWFVLARHRLSFQLNDYWACGNSVVLSGSPCLTSCRRFSYAKTVTVVVLTICWYFISSSIHHAYLQVQAWNEQIQNRFETQFTSCTVIEPPLI